ILQHAITDLADATQNVGDAPGDRSKSDDRQLMDRHQRYHAHPCHLVAAAAGHFHVVTKPPTQRVDQGCTEPIAGRLGRDQKNARRMRRDSGVHADSPVTKMPARSPAAITASGSAISVWPATTAIPASSAIA